MTQSPGNGTSATLSFQFQGRQIQAQTGQSVAAALLQAGFACLRIDEFGAPKGVFCGIGNCWECRCVINGAPNTRACQTPVQQGMVVEMQIGLE